MSLEDFMNSRRTFLQRSALGAGSVLFAPLLLESCTDHLIPDPVGTNPPVKPPLLGDNSTDWNNDAKVSVKFALGYVPIAGAFLNALVDIFWPSSQLDVWSLVKDQVNALIDQKIADYAYDQVKADLGGLDPIPTGTGLVSLVNTYQYATKSGTGILDAWQNAKNAFSNAQLHFQDEDNKVPLLPLFAQYANMYLALLRDGVKYGQSWGRTPDEHNTIDVPALTNTISDFQTYAATTYNTGRFDVIMKNQDARTVVQPFTAMNAYDRSMTMLVLDYMDTWKYYDISQYPDGAQNPDGTPITLFTREIYSDPYGYFVNSSGIGIPAQPVLPSPPTQLPTQIIIWGGERIDAVQLTYPAGSGPNGVTMTPRMGDKNGGSNQPPHGGIVDIPPGNYIQSAMVTYSDFGSNGSQLINTIQFTLRSSNTISYFGPFGGSAGDYKPDEIKYDNYALSSIYIHGTNDYLKDTSADFIVFGFMPLP